MLLNQFLQNRTKLWYIYCYVEYCTSLIDLSDICIIIAIIIVMLK